MLAHSLIAFLILCIVCTTKLRAKEDHTTSHRQTHNHQPPQDRGHINLCEETGQAYYYSIHDIQGEDVPADQVHNRLQQDSGPVRGGAKSSQGATVNRNKADMEPYSTVSFSKQPQASKEAALYAQVVFATDQQEEASASALYAQVDEKRKKNKTKKEEDAQPHEPGHLYAQVDKKKSKKKKEDSPSSELDQLYAQVDKKSKKKEDSPPPELDQLYAQVDKKKRKKREKEEIEEVPPGDVYSVVNKPSAPPVPLKSHLLMKELH